MTRAALPPDPVTTEPVTIRPSSPDDAPAVARLAALDSRRVPAGPLLLAEIGGEPWAAIALDTGTAFADPFRPTAALVDLLRRRAEHLAAATPPRRARRRRRRKRAALSPA
jgi:hypothetical protein